MIFFAPSRKGFFRISLILLLLWAVRVVIWFSDIWVIHYWNYHNWDGSCPNNFRVLSQDRQLLTMEHVTFLRFRLRNWFGICTWSIYVMNNFVWIVRWFLKLLRSVKVDFDRLKKTIYLEPAGFRVKGKVLRLCPVNNRIPMGYLRNIMNSRLESRASHRRKGQLVNQLYRVL